MPDCWHSQARDRRRHAHGAAIPVPLRKRLALRQSVRFATKLVLTIGSSHIKLRKWLHRRKSRRNVAQAEPKQRSADKRQHFSPPFSLPHFLTQRMETSLDKDAVAGTTSASAAAPAAALAQPAAKLQRTVYSVLGAISFSHLLNDMIQSLILAIYPMLKDELLAVVRPDRPDHADLSDHRVAAATARRHLHRQASEAVFAAGRHGLHAGRPAADVDRAELRRAAAGRGAGRLRVVGVSSGIVAGRAHGLGRPARTRAVAVPGGRQCGHRRSGRCSPR